MKLKTALNEIAKRENLIGFLHHTEITRFADAAKFQRIDVSGGKSFKSLADMTVSAYKAKKIGNKRFSTAMQILFDANQCFVSTDATALHDYVITEKSDVNATRAGRNIQAKTLADAKRSASRGQFFKNTVLVIANKFGGVLSIKQNGEWNDVE